MYGTLLRDEATPFVRPDRHDEDREAPPRSRAWEFRLAAAAAVLVACVAVSAADAMRNDTQRRSEALAQRLAAEKKPVTTTTTTKSAPHIVLFLVDDMGYGDVGWGSEDIVNASKFLTKFAAEGVTLDRYYTMMDCTPARASLLSGRYAIHTGMQHDCISSQSEWNLPHSVQILPQYLASAASYKSHIVGKWDLGHYTAKMWPQHRGFESFYGLTCYGYDDYSTHTDRGYYDLHSDFHNEKRTGDYSTFLFSEAATSIISDHDTSSSEAKPLFLYVAWNAVHGTVSVPSGFNETDEYLSIFPSDTMDEYKALRRTFAGALYLMDQGMRSVYEAVQAKGMYDNTVFIVLSDNGADPSTGGLSWCVLSPCSLSLALPRPECLHPDIPGPVDRPVPCVGLRLISAMRLLIVRLWPFSCCPSLAARPTTNDLQALPRHEKDALRRWRACACGGPQRTPPRIHPRPDLQRSLSRHRLGAHYPIRHGRSRGRRPEGI